MEISVDEKNSTE